MAALRDAASRQGHNVLLAPVRPTAKHLEQRVTMTDYVSRQGDDGFPTGPWLRVHVKVGGSIQRIASASMTVSGSLAQWRQWTGLPFNSDGDIDGQAPSFRCTVTPQVTKLSMSSPTYGYGTM